MSNNKSQISPIPPEGYGERFVKFISGLTMTKEEQERTAESGEQLDGSIDTVRHSSFPISRKSHENKVVEKAENQASKTEKDGATEEPSRDRTLSSVRSPSAERSGGHAGATLPVVEEDREASSREASVKDQSPGPPLPNGVAGGSDGNQSPALPPNDETSRSRDTLPKDKQLPSIPNFNRLSMGLRSSMTPSIER